MHRTGKGKWTAAMCNIKLATIDTNTVLVSYRNCNHSSKESIEKVIYQMYNVGHPNTTTLHNYGRGNHACAVLSMGP